MNYESCIRHPFIRIEKKLQFIIYIFLLSIENRKLPVNNAFQVSG